MGVLSCPIASFMPLDGATFYAIHENLTLAPLVLVWRVILHMRSAQCGNCMQTPCLLWALMGLTLLVAPQFLGGCTGFDWSCCFGIQRFHHWWVFALVCSRSPPPLQGCCTGEELRMGEVVGIEGPLKEEEGQAKAHA